MKAFAAALILAAAITACGDDPLPTISASANPMTFANGGTTKINVTVEHFTLSDPAGMAHGLRANDEGHEHGTEPAASDGTVSARSGHLHVYLDSTDVNPIKMTHHAEFDLTITSTPGAHRLILRLQGEDHKIVTPETKTHIDIVLE